MLNFSNSYSLLGDMFYRRVLPTPVPAPELLLWNSALADSLQIDPAIQNDRALLAQLFSGNQLADEKISS